MPWLGDAVTVTVARSGRASAAPRAFFSGINSNFGAADERTQGDALLLGEHPTSSSAEPHRHLVPPST